VKGSLQTLIFAIALGVTSAVLLTGAARITAPYVEKNRQEEKIRNLLAVFEINVPAGADHEQLLSIYRANVVEPKETDDPKFYRYVPGGSGESRAVAVHFIGKGLWGPVKGFLALDPGLTTFVGVTFYEQEETPGLGGEIATKDFTDRFKGKKVRDLAGRTGIRILRSGASGPNEIDGLSGATLTCDKVQEMLNQALGQIVKEARHGE